MAETEAQNQPKEIIQKSLGMGTCCATMNCHSDIAQTVLNALEKHYHLVPIEQEGSAK